MLSEVPSIPDEPVNPESLERIGWRTRKDGAVELYWRTIIDKEDVRLVYESDRDWPFYLEVGGRTRGRGFVNLPLPRSIADVLRAVRAIKASRDDTEESANA